MWRSQIILVAACNLCPCGWFGSSLRTCHCPVTKILAYRRKISGPILDRIDMYITMPEIKEHKAQLFLGGTGGRDGASVTKRMRERVAEARSRALHRNKKFAVLYNRDLAVNHLCAASGLPESVFQRFIERLFPASISNRGIVKALKIARSCADLAGRDEIVRENIEQAIAWQAEHAAKSRGDDALGISV